MVCVWCGYRKKHHQYDICFATIVFEQIHKGGAKEKSRLSNVEKDLQSNAYT